jgi:hypothetical protein
VAVHSRGNGGLWLWGLFCAVASFALFALNPAAASADACPSGWAGPNGGCELPYTGAPQTVTVPAGVTDIAMSVYGANGPYGPYHGSGTGDPGGLGGAELAAIPVSPGDQLTVIVGGCNGNCIPPNQSFAPATTLGGYGGGGAGGAATSDYSGTAGAGGGGGSFVFDGSRLLIAAGGGGGGADNFGNQNTLFGGGPGAGAVASPSQDGGSGQLCNSDTGGGAPGGGGEDASETGGGAGGSAGSQPANPVRGYPAAPANPGDTGSGPATSPTTLGVGGAGGAGGGTAGGGGGGGYYGGGGGGAGCVFAGGAGAGGVGYVISTATDAESMAGVGGSNVNGDGFVILRSVSPPTGISGTITTPFGDGLGGVTVKLTGTVSTQTTTQSNGSYAFTGLAAGTYTVTPVAGNLPAGGDEFTPTECDNGTAAANSCSNMSLAADQSESANFTAAYTLNGTVTGLGGQGVAGATVLIQDTEQGVLQKTTATTNAQGQLVASAGATSLGVPLAPGSVVVSVQTLNGTAFFPVPGAGTDPDCVTSGVSCDVNLNEDRTIAFSACVVPNPDGAPLPEPFADSTDPIPGAVTAPPLEAVGCWTPTNGSASTATEFTTDQPIRLDGVDVNPSQGTTFTLDTSGAPVVTSIGPAQILVGGWPVTLSHQISLGYANGVNSAGGAGVSIGDLGAGTGPLAPSLIAPNVWGLPISLGTGGPAGYGLPFVESTGQTAINLGAQFALPFDTRARWDVLAGKFVNIAGDDVPSLGLSGQVIATDRMGVVGQICGSVNDWKPFGGAAGELSGLTICYTPSQRQWTGNAMWETPTAIAKVIGDIYATVTLQNAIAASTGRLQGYKLQAFQVQFDHLATNTISLRGIVPGLSTTIKESGIPLGAGFFLQSLGAGFKNNLTSGRLASLNGTIGVSIGPEFNVASQAINLIRFDGKAEILPPQNAGDAWVYQLAGAATLGRLTPFELQLANGAVTFRADPSSPDGDFTFHLGGTLPVVGGVSMNIAGQSDVPHGLAFEGTTTLKLFSHVGTDDVLLNAPYVGLSGLPAGTPPAVLADCFTTSSGWETGFTVDFVSLTPKIGCNMSGLYHPHLLPQATGSSGRLTAARAVKMSIPAGLKGTMLAVYGHGAPPRFTVSGPGVRVTVPATSTPGLHGQALIFKDKVGRISYVGLAAPRTGVYTIRPLAGSASITKVLESKALPAARIVAAHVVTNGCVDRLHYRLQGAAGERALVYAEQGGERTAVGYLRAGVGSLKLALLAGVKGHGTLVAYYLRGHDPVGVQTGLASFKAAGSNGSEHIRGIRLSRSTLTWEPTCGASSYLVTIRHHGTTTTETVAKPRLKATAGTPLAVTVEALAAGGQIIARAGRTINH